jgi:hypothetical protein
MPDDTKAFPTQSNRDRSLPHNQLRPASTRSSGAELDEFCPEIEQASAGLPGLDGLETERGPEGGPAKKPATKPDDLKSRKEIYEDQVSPGMPPPMMSAEGNAEAEILGQSLTFRRASGVPMKSAHMMSNEGAQLSKKSAPRSAFAVDRWIGTSPVDRVMRGNKGR